MQSKQSQCFIPGHETGNHWRGWSLKVSSSSVSEVLARRHLKWSSAARRTHSHKILSQGPTPPPPRGSGMLGRWPPRASDGHSQQPYPGPTQNLSTRLFMCHPPPTYPVLRLRRKEMKWWHFTVIIKWNDQPLPSRQAEAGRLEIQAPD